MSGKNVEKIHQIIFFGAVLCCYAIAFIIQKNLFLNWDVSNLIVSTKLLLQGGTYTQDFFMPNPPMILFLYTPPVLFSQFFEINIIPVFRCYIFIVASISLYYCYCLTKKIFSQQDQVIAYIFLLVLINVFFILPLFHLGQRDHLLVIFSMPYLLAGVCYLQDKRLERKQSTMIGLMMGIGCSIKPHFLLMPLLVECYIAYKKNWRSFFRLETMSFTSVLFIYGLSILLFYPDYLFVIMPYVFRYYYQSVAEPWGNIVNNVWIFLLPIPAILYVIQFRQNPYRIFSTLLLLALIAALFSFLSQRTSYYYHIIPTASFIILLTTLLLLCTWRIHNRGINYVFSMTIGMLFFSFVALLLGGGFSEAEKYQKNILTLMIDFMHSKPPHQKIYFFSEGSVYASPMIDYTGSILTQRFDCLWMIYGLARYPQNENKQYRQDKKFFIDMIADDLAKHKPDLIFVSRHTSLNYLAYFSDNQLFLQSWKFYRYLKTLENERSFGRHYFKFDVYQRVDKEVENAKRKENSRRITSL